MLQIGIWLKEKPISSWNQPRSWMLVPWIAAGSRSCSERLTGSEWSSPLKVSAGCRWRCRSFVQHYSNKSSWSSHPGRLTSNRWQRLVLHLSFQIQGECLKVAEIRDWDKSYTNSWKVATLASLFHLVYRGKKNLYVIGVLWDFHIKGVLWDFHTLWKAAIEGPSPTLDQMSLI